MMMLDAKTVCSTIRTAFAKQSLVSLLHTFTILTNKEMSETIVIKC